ncbi:MAG: hypothetical protein LBC72_05225 [Spirochaetaceae bacterium]|jgi:hypothetical protein|nr:hypothetical protein [Spirochaetaceae bacterium]
MTNEKMRSADDDGGKTRFIDNFPSTSLTKDKIIAICEKPRTCPFALNRLIHLDPILFGRTQFIYNFFYPDKIHEYVPVAKIITVLHLNTIRNYARQAALNTPFCDKAALREEEKQVKRAFVRAYAARLLAERGGIEAEKLQQYYAAGLLFDFPNYVSRGKKAQAAEVARYWRFCEVLHDVLVYKDAYKKYSGKYKHVLFTALAANYLAEKIIRRTVPAGRKPSPVREASATRDSGAGRGAAAERGGLDGAIQKYLGVASGDVHALMPLVTAGLETQLLFLRGEP